jgi:hypothetical protein
MDASWVTTAERFKDACIRLGLTRLAADVDKAIRAYNAGDVQGAYTQMKALAEAYDQENERLRGEDK